MGCTRYTPRERCYRAVRREEVDMVPVSIWVEAPEPLNNLLSNLGCSDIEKLLVRLEIDYRGFLPNLSWLGIGLKGGFKEESFKDDRGRLLRRDRFGIVSAMSLDGRTSMQVDHPLKHIDVKDYPFPEVKEEDFDLVQKFRKKFEDYCVIAYTLQPFEKACALFGYSTLFKLMFKEPWKVDYVLDKLFSIAEKQAKLLAEAGVDQVYGGDDAGAQNTMLISPAQWRRFLKPRYKKLADTIHRRGAFFHFHSDGWIQPIIPDLIEVGVDVLEPVQPESMDIAEIKRLYGDRLSFEGGIGVQRLPFKKPAEIREEVKRTLRVMGPTGYTLRPSHTILPDTPIENIVTLYDAANKYRRLL